MKRFYVFLLKQEHFWCVHTFLKIRKLKKIFQTDLHKILLDLLSFSVVSPHQKRNVTRLLSPQTEFIQVDSRLAERLRKSQNRGHA